MGCCSSQPSKPVPSEVGEWSKYEELVRAIFADPLKGPTEEHLISIRSCKLSALEPENKTDPPLLVVAMDHDEWFSFVVGETHIHPISGSKMGEVALILTDKESHISCKAVRLRWVRYDWICGQDFVLSISY